MHVHVFGHVAGRIGAGTYGVEAIAAFCVRDRPASQASMAVCGRWIDAGAIRVIRVDDDVSAQAAPRSVVTAPSMIMGAPGSSARRDARMGAEHARLIVEHPLASFARAADDGLARRGDGTET